MWVSRLRRSGAQLVAPLPTWWVAVAAESEPDREVEPVLPTVVRPLGWRKVVEYRRLPDGQVVPVSKMVYQSAFSFR
jgi:hypothetical protein